MHKDRIGNAQAVVQRVPTSMVVAAISQQLKALQQYAADNDIEIDASSIKIDSFAEDDHERIVIDAEATEPRQHPRIIAIEK